jgi:hypothetical protein
MGMGHCRGELQYKEVKLPADKILENLGDERLPRSLQVAYVATDERNKTFFDAFKKRFKTVRPDLAQPSLICHCYDQ